MIPTIYKMMHLQITCVNVRFITHIIALCNTDVTSGYLCYLLVYYKLHSDMYALQYVNVHVPSDYLRTWMFHYTHHRDMDAMQYVHVDVPSDYFYH